jgi:1-acyl-sn-glycerol-3-phosphate acyltransferase
VDFWYSTVRRIGLLYQKFFIPGLKVEGTENLFPGPKIVVANHSFASDVFVIPSVIQDHIHFLVEYDLYSLPVIGKLLTWADQIPVIAGRGEEALASAYKWLEQGHSIVIFPEGRLNHGKEVSRARTGAIRLAVDSGYPLLPLGIYTPPEFAKPISAHFFGRDTLGGWQFGGSSFVSIGAAWDLSDQIRELQATKGYRALRIAADELRDRLDLLVQRSSDLAGQLSLPK